MLWNKIFTGQNWHFKGHATCFFLFTNTSRGQSQDSDSFSFHTLCYAASDYESQCWIQQCIYIYATVASNLVIESIITVLNVHWHKWPHALAHFWLSHIPSTTSLTCMVWLSSFICSRSEVMYRTAVTGSVTFTGNCFALKLHKKYDALQQWADMLMHNCLEHCKQKCKERERHGSCFTQSDPNTEHNNKWKM